MKRRLVGLILASALIGGPVFAETAKHNDEMCKKHCNLMELKKKVEALKSQESSADKTATREHLRKDIEAYEKKLQELKTEIETK